MKNKGFLFKLLALVSAVASVVFACLLKINVKISAGGESAKLGNAWSVFGDAERAEKVELAQLGSIDYDETLRTFAVFLIVVLAIIVILLTVFTLYGKFASEPFEACSGTCNILSVVVSLIGVVFLITVDLIFAFAARSRAYAPSLLEITRAISPLSIIPLFWASISA